MRRLYSALRTADARRRAPDTWSIDWGVWGAPLSSLAPEGELSAETELVTAVGEQCSQSDQRLRELVGFDLRTTSLARQASLELLARLTDELPTARHNLVLIAALQSGAGTTTTAMQLAVAAIGHLQGRVLLVDASGAGQLGARLHSEAAASANSSTMSPVGTCVPRLDVATCDAAAVAGRQMAGGMLRISLARWRAEYRLIVIDGGVATADAALALARLADATCLVMRAGASVRPIDASAVDRLRRAGARIAGCALVGDEQTH